MEAAVREPAHEFMDEALTQAATLERLNTVAQHVRGSLDFGRSRSLNNLFDYILERTLRGETTREIDVATEVLGRPATDILVDASARVYVHRLRKKIDDFYSGPGLEEQDRLALPKGEYRFALSPNRPGATDEETAEVTPEMRRLKRHHWVIALLLLAGPAIGFAVGAVVMNQPAFTSEQAEVRKSALWSPLIDSNRPLAIVPGDYYIFGERDAPGAEPARLVREFTINSREELDEVMMFDPKLRDRYVDLDLHYLPVTTATALKSITALVGSRKLDQRATQLVASSDLSPTQLKSNDLVYVGLLSGLGLLQQAVFSNSRFGFGGSFDEIIDTKTGKIYISEPPRDSQTPRRNFAYIASLPGPNGNRLLIVAGTRDAGLLEAVAMATSSAGAAQLSNVSKDGYFEALYAVDGMGAENLKGTLIAAEPRSPSGIWEAMTDPPEAATSN